MDQPSIVNLVRPYLPVFIRCPIQAFNDFDAHHPPDVRLTVEESRPLWMNLRTMHFLEMEFGTTGSPRVIRRQDRLGYLYVEGEEFSIGLRPKKLNDRWRSSNHRSAQQDELRRCGRFPWHKDTCHVFLGYRTAGGLQPSLTHVALTFESPSQVEWVHMLWTPGEGENPVQTIQSPLPFLPPPTIRVRRPAASDENSERTG